MQCQVVTNPAQQVDACAKPAAVTVRPAVDIVETADQYTIVADLPGVTPEQLTLETEQNKLTLRAAGQLPQSVRGQRPGRREVNFVHSFSLGAQVDREKIHAALKHGVLQITLPKLQKAQPVSVPVQVQ
jgi:HSP20 family protein